MSDSHFISTDAQLCKFLQSSGRDWRATMYIECGNCPRSCSHRCKDLLCAFNSEGMPVLVPIQDVEHLLHVTVDKSECLSVMSRAVFCELYKAWIDCHIADPHVCPLMDLRIEWVMLAPCGGPKVFNL